MGVAAQLRVQLTAAAVMPPAGHAARLMLALGDGGDTEMRVLVLVVLAIIILAPPVHAQTRPTDREIIQAFLDCPEIIAAQEEFSRGAQAGRPRIVLRNSLCGFVGCQFNALVAQPFERRKADPFIRHLLAYVHVDTKGIITLVERVEIVPTEELRRSEAEGDAQ